MLNKASFLVKRFANVQQSVVGARSKMLWLQAIGCESKRAALILANHSRGFSRFGGPGSNRGGPNERMAFSGDE